METSRTSASVGRPSGPTVHPNGDPVPTTRTAIVHDWLPVYGGAERVLEQMLETFPSAEVYSLFDFLSEEHRKFLKGRSVHTSFFQRLPRARNRYRYYLPFAPLAIEQFDLRGYERVISSSFLVAKGALTTADQFHLSYVHSPPRYAWDLQFSYLRQRRMERGLRSWLARAILHYIRLFDVVSANRVDAYVANSYHVARRIWKTYRRHATVVYPPVDTDAFALYTQKEEYYVTLSRLVDYKRVNLLVDAFAEMPDQELIVIGDGPERRRLEAKAGPNVTILGYQPMEAVVHYLQRARAFVYAAEEDFGITAVEAQACGTSVIAYGKGGLTETVIPGKTGVLFRNQTVEDVVAALREHDRIRPQLEPEYIREHAERFSRARFLHEFREVIEREYHAFYIDGPPGIQPDLSAGDGVLNENGVVTSPVAPSPPTT